MDTHRIHIFHAADRDAVSLGISNHFKLDLFPTGDTLLHQDLRDRRHTQTIGRDLLHLLHIVRDTTAGSPQCERRTNDHRIADLIRECQRRLQIIHNLRRNAGFADRKHRILEHLPVFRLINGIRTSAQKTHAMAFQKTFLRQLHGQGQASLSTQRRQNAVRLLLLDDPLHGFQCQRLNIDMIRHGLIRHNCCGIRVNENDFQALLLQCAAGLRSRIVKLRGLSDDDGPGTNHHYLLEILIQRHLHQPPSSS